MWKSGRVPTGGKPAGPSKSASICSCSGVGEVVAILIDGALKDPAKEEKTIFQKETFDS